MTYIYWFTSSIKIAFFFNTKLKSYFFFLCRWNLVKSFISTLHFSVSHFPPNSGGLLRGGSQRLALPLYRNVEIKIINISLTQIPTFHREWESNPQPSRPWAPSYSSIIYIVPLHHDVPIIPTHYISWPLSNVRITNLYK